MRFLLVNDDGIQAPGLLTLARAALRFGEVWLVAPARQCSGMSQKLSIFDEMHLKSVEYPALVRTAWSLDGTPADCVKLALEKLLPEKPDFVLSGVNNGWNCGFDIAYSGTVGACMEAVSGGVPAMAFSAPDQTELAGTEALLPAILEELLAQPLEPGEIWNVNFPKGGPDEICGILRNRKLAPRQFYNGFYYSRTDEDGREFYRQKGMLISREQAADGSDIAAVLDGFVSVGKIKSFLF